MPGFDRAKAEMLEAWYRSESGREHLRLQKDMILRLLQPRRGERLLDVGCGSGRHIQMFKREGLDVTGVDPSICMLDLAEQRLGCRAGLFPGSGEDLPFEDNEFEIVTMIHCLEFMSSPDEALAEAVRVTRNRIFIGVFNSLSLGALTSRARSLVRDGVYRDAKFFSLWDILSRVRRVTGPTPIRWASVGLFPPSLSHYMAGLEGRPLAQKTPFGSFIGISANVTYTFRTDNLAVRAGLKLSGKHAATPTPTSRTLFHPDAGRPAGPPSGEVRL